MQNKHKNVLICGNYGIGNLGDEAILAGIIRLIKSANLNTEITVFSSNHEYTKKNFKVNTVDYFPAGLKSMLKFWLGFRFWKTFRALMGADLVILGGGGLFADEKPRAVWIWFVQSLWFYLFGKKVFCLGQSVGPLKSVWARKITAWVFMRAAKVSVRDLASKELLEQLGVSDVETIADPAYAIGYDNASFHKRNNYAVLSLRTWIKGDQQINIELAKTVDWLFKEHKLKTLFIPFQTDEDLSKFDEIYNLVKNKNAIEIISNEVDFQYALEVISRARLVLGMRLHSIIFAVLSKTSFIALSYTKKVKDFVKTLKMDFWMDYDKANFADLKKQINFVIANEKEISKELEKQKLHFTYEVFKQEKMIRELLGN